MSSLRIVCWFLVQALMSACLLPSVEQRSHNDTGTIPPLMTGPTSNAATAPAGDAGGDSTHHTPSQPPGSPDCSAAACSMKDQVCDTQNSACVDCLADEHCKTGQICEANSKKCMGCRDDSDCRTGELRTCNTQTATCVECLEGRTSTGCQRHDRPACWGQRCVECSQDSDCATTTLTRPLCRTETHACVECNSDRDCTRPNASHCNDMTHTCEPCTALEQCKHVPGLTECDTKSRKCVECVDGGRACGSEAGLTVCDAKDAEMRRVRRWRNDMRRKSVPAVHTQMLDRPRRLARPMPGVPVEYGVPERRVRSDHLGHRPKGRRWTLLATTRAGDL